MSVSILPYITGAGGAIVVLALGIYLFLNGKIIPEGTHDAIVADKDKQIDLLTAALDRERVRNEAGVLAAQTATSVLQALHREVTQ